MKAVGPLLRLLRHLFFIDPPEQSKGFTNLKGVSPMQPTMLEVGEIRLGRNYSWVFYGHRVNSNNIHGEHAKLSGKVVSERTISLDLEKQFKLKRGVWNVSFLELGSKLRELVCCRCEPLLLERERWLRE